MTRISSPRLADVIARALAGCCDRDQGPRTTEDAAGRTAERQAPAVKPAGVGRDEPARPRRPAPARTDLATPVLALAVAVALAGCGDDDKGPMQKTGEAVDKAAQKTEEGAKKATEKTGEAVEKAGETVKDSAK